MNQAVNKTNFVTPFFAGLSLTETDLNRTIWAALEVFYPNHQFMMICRGEFATRTGRPNELFVTTEFDTSMVVTAPDIGLVFQLINAGTDPMHANKDRLPPGKLEEFKAHLAALKKAQEGDKIGNALHTVLLNLRHIHIERTATPNIVDALVYVIKDKYLHLENTAGDDTQYLINVKTGMAQGLVESYVALENQWIPFHTSKADDLHLRALVTNVTHVLFSCLRMPQAEVEAMLRAYLNHHVTQRLWCLSSSVLADPHERSGLVTAAADMWRPDLDDLAWSNMRRFHRDITQTHADLVLTGFSALFDLSQNSRASIKQMSLRATAQRMLVEQYFRKSNEADPLLWIPKEGLVHDACNPLKLAIGEPLFQVMRDRLSVFMTAERQVA